VRHPVGVRAFSFLDEDTVAGKRIPVVDPRTRGASAEGRRRSQKVRREARKAGWDQCCWEASAGRASIFRFVFVGGSDDCPRKSNAGQESCGQGRRTPRSKTTLRTLIGIEGAQQNGILVYTMLSRARDSTQAPENVPLLLRFFGVRRIPQRPGHRPDDSQAGLVAPPSRQ